jgi:two-component system chemotaxis response regulator CheB
MLEADVNIEVVSIAGNGREALEILDNNRGAIDCVTLDVNMPVMQGDTALKHIMIKHSVPALILSSIEPQIFHKVFEFLQVGAVDFLPKPASGNGNSAYLQRLRALVKGTASAEVSHFRRYRPSKADSAILRNKAAPDRQKMLVILGAEGAYMDWFRLPLTSLCRQGLVLGFQKLPDPFVEKFGELITAKTGQFCLPIGRSEAMTPGGFYLGNAGRTVATHLVLEPLTLKMQPLHSAELEWQEGVPLLLEQLAKQARGRLSVLLLSAAHGLPSELVERLLEYRARLICSPRDRVLCTQLVDSVRDYAYLYPEGVVWGNPENLMEDWS